MDLRLTVTLEPPYTEADAEKLLEHATELHEELGPVIDLDAAGALSLTIAYEADLNLLAEGVIEQGARFASQIISAAFSEVQEVAEVNLTPVLEHERELQPA